MKVNNLKKILLPILMFSILSVTGCEGGSDTNEVLTASQVLEYLETKCTNIGNYVEYTAETDSNGLLGEPNQYTSKINGADTRLEQTDENSPVGFSIEVFANNTDAQSRADYIENIYTNIPSLAEYDYVNDYILLRVDGSLTSDQAKEYEEAINDIFD